MRRMPTAALAALLLFSACGDDGADASSTTASPSCPPAVQVSTVDDLSAVLAQLAWRGLGAYTSGPVPITADLTVTGTVALEAADLPIPADCRDRPDCSPDGRFWMGSAVAGVSASGEVSGTCGSGIARLTFTDTTFRLRPFLYDTHPCLYNFVPVVEVLPPCGTSCGEGSQMCPADGACYAAGDSYCRLCTGGSKEECACRDEEGPLAEGSSCSFWQSGDRMCMGNCRAGSCVSAECP